MKPIIFFGLFALMALEVGACQRQSKPVVYVLDADLLMKNRKRVKAKDPLIMPAYNALVKDADKAMDLKMMSVMEKKHMPPSGDRHDYMSLAPYHWPDTSKPGGMPYIRKDGQTNPEVKEYKDKEYLPLLCEGVHTLALAYFFTGEKMYAAHAARLMRTWFLDTFTRMNPNLNFGQAIKGVNTGRGAGLIDTRHLIKITDAIGLIRDSKYWKLQDQQGMESWFTAFLNWMETSPIGIDEMKAQNNHGAWYDAQRLAMALFINNKAAATKIVLNAKQRLDAQMDTEGKFPKEMERTMSLHYTAFVMNAFILIAQMADGTGADLWKFTSPSGKSLKKGIEALLPYIMGGKKWEGQQIREFNTEETFPLLLEAYARYDCKGCKAAIPAIAGEKSERLRINLYY